jgi:hypothetical protein
MCAPALSIYNFQPETRGDFLWISASSVGEDNRA